MPTTDAHATLNFLQRLPNHQTETPYSIPYRVPGWQNDTPRSNYATEQIQHVLVRDIRGREDVFSFNTHGFAVVDVQSSLAYDKYANRQIVDEIHSLWAISLTKHDWFDQHVQSIIFVATPHIDDTLESSFQNFESVLRYEPTWKPWNGKRPRISKADRRSSATSSRRFEKLKLDCLVLSRCEQVSIWMGFSTKRQVQLVDQVLAETCAKRKIFACIDCTISDIFTDAICAVHDNVTDFHSNIGEDYNQVKASSDTCIPPVSHPSRDALPSSSASSSPINLQDSTPKSSLRIGQNTPLTHYPASEESYVVVHKTMEARVPDHVQYVQNPSYTRPNPDFKGRENVILEMQKLLLPSSPTVQFPKETRSFIIGGHAGLGKTQTASHFFHTYKNEFDVTLWVQATNKDTLATGFNQIAAELGIHNKETIQDPLQKQRLVVDWLRSPIQDSTKAQKRYLNWLLVFDNADEPSILVDYWPKYAPGSVIVTTQDPMLRQRGEFGHEGVDMTSLTTSQAVSLLQSKLPRPLWENEDENVLIEVVKALSCWPIAIVRMAGNMEILNQTPSRFLNSYEKEQKRSKYFRRIQGFQDGYGTAVSSLWTFSNPESEASRLLSVMSLLLPETIPEVILTQNPERAQLQGYPVERMDYDFAVLELVASSTIGMAISSSQDHPGEITIHSFVQEVVRSRLFEDEDRTAETFNATVRLVMTVWPCETTPRFSYYEHNNYDAWRHRDRIVPHMAHLRRNFDLLTTSTKRKCATEDYLILLSETAWYHFQRFNLDEAEEVVQATLEAHKMSALHYPQIVAGQYGTWAQIAIALNKLDLAHEKSAEALRIRQKIYEETNVVFSQLVASYATLGRVKTMIGELKESRLLIEKSISLRRAMPKFSTLQLYTPLVYLAFVAFREGETEHARLHLTEALAHREEVYGKDDTKSTRAGHLLLYLGIVHVKLGRTDDALGFLRRAYHQFREVVGEDDFNTAEACYELASLHFRIDTIGTAQIMIERAVAVFSRSKYHVAHHARALFLEHHILNRAGETNAAEQAIKTCVSLCKQLFPDNTPEPGAMSEADFDRLLPPWFR